MRFLSNNSIITEYLEFSGHSGELKKGTLQKWADFLVSKMPYVEYFEHVIKLVDVKDYQCEKPAGFEELIQLAFCANKNIRVKRTEVVEWTQQLHNGTGCELVISLKCDTCQNIECTCNSPEVVVDVDRMWELNHPEFKYGHMAWYYRHGGLGNDNIPISPYHPKFKVIGPSRDGFFNADQYIKGCLNLSAACKSSPEKFVLDEKAIRFNVREGKALISYFSVPIDPEGYRKIPDIPELIEAITWYIHERLAFIEYNKTRDTTYQRDYIDARNQKEKFMGIARERILSQDYQSFQRDLGAFYGRYLPTEDAQGNVIDLYHNVMSKLNLK